MATQTKTTPTTAVKKKNILLAGGGMALLSKFAKALMVPIAILPFAALINRFGDLFQSLWHYDHGEAQAAGMDWLMWIGIIMQKPGAVVFDNLSLMFAIGIGFGLSEDFRGEAALAAAVAFLGLQAMTGQGALAELFYGHVMTYNSDAIHNQIDPIISALNNSSTSGTANILNLDGPVRATLDDGQIIDYQGLIGDKGYFDGLSQLLYFVKGTNIISATDELGNAGYVIAPNVIYMLDVGVLGGIVAGGTVAVLYNNFREIKIPEALSFFGGRRFIPMLAIASVWGLGLVFAIVWPWCQLGLISAGTWIAGAGNEAGRVFGFGLYAFFNRLVQPLGLHHIINTFLWFQFPIAGPTLQHINDAGVQTSDIVFGDINAFQAGVLGSGIFQAGFFPQYMGGYVGIAVALTLATPKENRGAMGAFFASTGFVAFLTGIDEPILFAFMFASPILWIINCLMVPIFGMIVTAQHISLGFGFSAGLIDYLISLPSSWQMSQWMFNGTQWVDAGWFYSLMANPLWIFVWAAAMGVSEGFIFYFIAKKMNVAIEGNEYDEEGKLIIVGNKQRVKGAEKYENLANAVMEIVKPENILEVTNCTTRLRLTVVDNKEGIDDAKLKAAGFNGVMRPGGKEALQLIVGTDVENVTNKLNQKLKAAGWTKPTKK